MRRAPAHRAPAHRAPAHRARALLAALLLATACRTPPPPAPADPVDLAPVTGPELRQKIQEAARDHVVVVNVWATWCDPCKEELPDFVRIRERYAPRGVELLLVSTDPASTREDARAFLQAQHAAFQTYIKSGSDDDFIAALEPRWSGALPLTLIYGRGGAPLLFFEGRVGYEQLEVAVQKVLRGPEP